MISLTTTHPYGHHNANNYTSPPPPAPQTMNRTSPNPRNSDAGRLWGFMVLSVLFVFEGRERSAMSMRENVELALMHTCIQLNRGHGKKDIHIAEDTVRKNVTRNYYHNYNVPAPDIKYRFSPAFEGKFNSATALVRTASQLYFGESSTGSIPTSCAVASRVSGRRKLNRPLSICKPEVISPRISFGFYIHSI